MEKYDLLRKLSAKSYVSVTDVSGLLGIKQASARVLCNRYAKEGGLIRLKNNFYLTEQNWEQAGQPELFRIANFLQVPSYISFLTALSLYEVTTQLQQDFFESACLRRSRKIEARERVFVYYKLRKDLYFDFIRKDNIFIAAREKAFMDAVYLFSFGKYALDFGSLDTTRLDKKRLKVIMRKFPVKTRLIAERLCKI